MQTNNIVLDSSVIIGVLEDQKIINAIFKLSFSFITTDFILNELFEKHNNEINILLKSGLNLYEFDEKEMEELSNIIPNLPHKLSFVDKTAYCLAYLKKYMLLTGDKYLRKLSESNNVDVHGILWLLEEINKKHLLTSEELIESMNIIQKICYLPDKESSLMIIQLKKNDK